MPLPNWMPALMDFGAYGGDWSAYLDALHAAFQADFTGQNLEYRGKRVGLKRQPIEAGKEATFWHLISEGNIEADRVPDLRRCERICWPRAILDNCEDACLSTWSETGDRGDKILIWCQDAEYLFVLADRGEYVLPWTAYPVVREHQQRKLQERFARSRNG